MLMSSICLTIFAANSAYSSIAPFYPNEALAKGVPPYTFGLIFACYSVAMFIASPLVNGAMNKYGRKKVMITGCLCEGIAMLAMALIDYTDSGVAFALLSALCRMVEGTGNACLNASASAII
jgi:MFS family permease